MKKRVMKTSIVLVGLLTLVIAICSDDSKKSDGRGSDVRDDAKVRRDHVADTLDEVTKKTIDHDDSHLPRKSGNTIDGIVESIGVGPKESDRSADMDKMITDIIERR